MNIQYMRPGWNWAHLALLVTVLAGLWLAHTQQWSLALTGLLASVWIIGWLVLAEWRCPHRHDWAPSPTDLKRDGFYFLLAAVTDGLTKWLIRGVAVLLGTQWGSDWGGGELLREWPLWMTVALALWIGEFGPYWVHRWAHAGGWLWRVHALHHAPSAVNTTNNVTAHPINVLWVELLRVLPLLLLGFSAEAIVYAGILAQAQSFATHANTPGHMGWLNLLIGTAELHRRHHSTREEEAMNYGTAVPLWDQIFGTYRWRAVPEPQQVGLFSPAAYPRSTDVVAWLTYPFRRMR